MRCAVLIVFAVMLLYGCEHIPQEYHIPNALKPLFNEGDTFFYKSSQKETLCDTLVVTNLYYGFSQEGDKKTTDIYEYMRCDMKSLASDIRFKFEEYVSGYIGIDVVDKNDVYQYFFDNKELKNIKIGEDEYYNVCELSQSDNFIFPIKIYYSRQYGVLKYIFSDSTCFLIDNKSVNP